MGDILSREFEKYRKVQTSYLTSKILYGLSQNPYTTEREQEYKEKILIFLLCLFSVNELMLTHHELALP